MICFIVEDTQEKAETIAHELKKAGTIKSFKETESFINHISRKTKAPIKKYRIECED